MFKHFKFICPRVKFLMKTDDDIFINTKLIEQILEKANSSTVIGYVKSNIKPLREIESKWFMPYWLYSKKYYPDYATGSGYIIPGKFKYNI